jgi:DNA-nicking Smr family endonuclease
MKKILEQPAISDADLFQQAVDGVIPIASSNRLPPTRPAIRIRQQSHSVTAPSISDNWSDHGSGDVAPTSFLRTGINNMTLRKLRRGLWPIRDEIDLHGLTSDEARRMLADFLNHASRNNYHCVNVIHGKGWRAEGGEGILKIRVRHWLTQQPQVLAFCEAPPNAGGGGAVWVLLKSQPVNRL